MKAFIALLILAAVIPASVDACSCMRESEDRKTAVAERLDRANLVFLGRIEGAQEFTVHEDGWDTKSQRTQFYILQSWKGEASNRVYVQTALECCLCEYRFPASGVFLVFAYGPNKDGVYETSSCDQPRRQEEAQEDAALLEQLTKSRRTNRSSRSREERAPAER